MTLGEFRKLTADLPDDIRLLTNAPDHCYRDVDCSIVTAIAHICASSGLEPDYGNDPTLYGYYTEEDVKKNRRTVVVIE